MKRCPTCNRTCTDKNLTFCIDDGTPLSTVRVDQAANESGGRIETPPYGSYEQPAYQPPGSYTPAPQPGKRRVWPWVVGIVGVLLVGIVGLGIAAAILIPRMIR